MSLSRCVVLVRRGHIEAVVAESIVAVPREAERIERRVLPDPRLIEVPLSSFFIPTMSHRDDQVLRIRSAAVAGVGERGQHPARGILRANLVTEALSISTCSCSARAGGNVIVPGRGSLP